MRADVESSSWREEARALARLALPVAAANLGMMALGVVDVIMVGHVSPVALAAVALGHTFSFALMIVGMGSLHVLDPLIAQAHGRGDEDAKADNLRRGVVMALSLAALVSIVLWHSQPVLEWIASQPAIASEAARYTRALAPGIPFFFVFVALRQSVQAVSVVRPVMIAVVAGNVANVPLNLGFVFGHFGLPALGGVGAGVASTLCRVLMAATLFVTSWPVLSESWRRPTREWRRVGSYRELFARGSHIGIQMALEVWMFNAVTFLMVRMGALQGAGHAVAMNLISVSYMIPLGIGAAAATRVGIATGRGDAAGARRSSAVALAAAVLVMAAGSALFVLCPRALAGLYTDDPSVVEMAATLLPIAALFQVFDGAQAVACGVLRGRGETRAPALINLLGYWVIGLPAGAALAYRGGLGPRGLWLGLTLGLLLVAILLIARVRAGWPRASALEAGDRIG